MPRFVRERGPFRRAFPTHGRVTNYLASELPVAPVWYWI